VIFAHHLLLDYALICTHVGRFLDEFEYGVCVYKSFERVNLWYRCVYCDQSGDGWRSGSHRVAEYEFTGVTSRSWCAWMFVGDHSIVVWGVDSADDRTAACLCVSPCRRLLRSAISYNKKLCRVCIWLCSVIDSSPSVVCWLYCVSWSFPSSRWTLDLLRRAQYFGVSSVKPYKISHYLIACTFAF